VFREETIEAAERAIAQQLAALAGKQGRVAELALWLLIDAARGVDPARSRCGFGGRTYKIRTCDQRIKSPLLYQLS
jgi:hypothetical protein